MNLRFVRVTFVIITGLMGSQLAFGGPWVLRFAIAALLGYLLVLLESSLHRWMRVSVRGLTTVVFGLLLGLIMAKLAADAINLVPVDPIVMDYLRVGLTWVFCYLCVVIALRGRDEFNLVIPYVRLARTDRGEEFYILDTSSIIDGRILDLCKTRFVEGRLIIPRFVLQELQTVADSSDSVKRSRGRRGLDVLNQLRNLDSVDVKVRDEDLPGIPEVDDKLVKLAQMLGARIITNDYNLNKVAEFQGVGVMNVNELAQALRPVVLPGEFLAVKPIKEGKEDDQAVAYLDDGTMVVVENGRGSIGQTVQGTVTSVLQTSAGRMVFVRLEGSGGGKA